MWIYNRFLCCSCCEGSSLNVGDSKIVDYVNIDTPAGIKLKLEINDPCINKNSASCSVTKDGGDDPDVTDGIKIYAKVSRRDDNKITIDGGHRYREDKKERLIW